MGTGTWSRQSWSWVRRSAIVVVWEIRSGEGEWVMHALGEYVATRGAGFGSRMEGLHDLKLADRLPTVILDHYNMIEISASLHQGFYN